MVQNSNRLQDFINNNDENKVLDSDIKDAVNKWLGIDIDTDDKAQSFKDQIDSIIDGLNDINTFKYDSESSWNAYVYINANGDYYNDGIMYFGTGLNNFTDGDTTSGLTLAGTIVHEGTHKKLNTSDLCYSKEDCLSLTNKTENANNWRYMYEKIYSNGD